MIAALLYLRWMSLVNAYRAKLLRLKQPRYLIGLVAGLGYFYFFIVRSLSRSTGALAQAMPFQMPDAQLVESVGACLLLAYLAGIWIFSTGRAALAFSEAEMAFLFPAPIARRTLIHFKLLSAQLRIVTSAAFFALFSQRWSAIGGSYFTHFIGCWIIFTFVFLHQVGSSFTRDRLLDLGLNPTRRRIAAVALVAGLLFVTYIWIQRTGPSFADGGGELSGFALLSAFVNAPPLRWIIWPLRLVIKPALVTDGFELMRWIGPAIGLLALEYVWCMKSEVAFEEASLANAKKRTARVEAMRTGKSISSPPKSARPEPFKLRSTGPRSVAFFWRNLIGVGSYAYPRVWLISAVALIAGVRWLIHQPDYGPYVKAVGMAATMAFAYALLFTPVFARRSSQRLLEQVDMVKALPLRGWEIILGEMLCSVVLLSVFEWLMLMVLSFALNGSPSRNVEIHEISYAIAAGQMVPFLGALLFSLNFAGVLLFPAWSYNPSGASGGGGGIDRLGQRLIFFVGYLIVALVALMPAAIGGLLVFFGLKFIFEYIALGAILGGTVGALILGGELAVILWWLGDHYEKFDLSTELPR